MTTAKGAKAIVELPSPVKVDILLCIRKAGALNEYLKMGTGSRESS